MFFCICIDIGIWFDADVETTYVSFSGDIQLEQEGLSGLYDPQVYIFLLNNNMRHNLDIYGSLKNGSFLAQSVVNQYNFYP